MSMQTVPNGVFRWPSRRFLPWYASSAYGSCPSLLVGVSHSHVFASTLAPCLTLYTNPVISKDRSDDALKVIRRLHQARGVHDDAFVQREMLQIQEQHRIAQSRQVTWKEMLTVPSYRKRLLIGIFIMFCSQFTSTMIVASMYLLSWPFVLCNTDDRPFLMC